MRPRFATNSDLWTQPPLVQRTSTKPLSRLDTHGHSAHPQRPRARRLLLRDFHRTGDSRQAVAAAGTLADFIEAQLGKLRRRDDDRRRRRRTDNVDPRLWLDEQHWIAWTIDGELVSVEEIELGSMRSSPEVRRLEPAELPSLLAAGRLITSVIALYRGDSLDRGHVQRYQAHFDVRRALEAALVRAQQHEEQLREVASIDPQPIDQPEPPAPRAKKSRHHPHGNLIAYRTPAATSDLPPFAAILQLPPVPAAFPTRKDAQRFIKRMPRLGLDPSGLQVARVMNCVEVEPVFRRGIQLPRDPERIIDLIRKEPRVVLPELKAVWQPRYQQAADGNWLLADVEKKGTVRNGSNRLLLQNVTHEGRRFAKLLEENAILGHAGSDEFDIQDQMSQAMRVVQKAERRLPGSWLDQLSMERESTGPDWFEIRDARPVADSGHWLRAPSEYGQPHSDGLRRRIVELKIDDLAGLFEMTGFRPRFLLLKETTSAAPRWALAVSGINCP